MTNEQRVKTLFAEANPIPDADLFDLDEIGGTAYLATLEQRSSEVTLTTHEEPDQKTKRGRGPLVLALGAAAVALLVLGLTLFESDTTDVADSGSSAVDTAESLHTAFNQGDFAAYQAHFAPDATAPYTFGWTFVGQLIAGPTPTLAPDSFGLQLEAECTEENPVRARCTWVQRGGVFERAGIDMTADTVLFFDEEGAIISQSMASVSSYFPLREFLPTFGSWLRDSHPDVFEATYDTVLPEPVSGDANDTLESRAQWAAVLDEFLEQSDTYPLNG